MPTPTSLHWIDGPLGSFTPDGRYSVHEEVRQYARSFRAVIFGGWSPQLPGRGVAVAEHIGPAFATLSAAKEYCESDWILGDEK